MQSPEKWRTNYIFIEKSLYMQTCAVQIRVVQGPAVSPRAGSVRAKSSGLDQTDLGFATHKQCDLGELFNLSLP